MASKKNKPTTSTAKLPALKIGSRVRCTDDGVEGRIVWANAVSVKIKWDDGEQVTWKRESLADRPIEILDTEPPAASEPNAEQTAVPTTAEETSGQEASGAQEEPTPKVPPAEPTLDVPAPEAIAEATPPTHPSVPTEAAASEPQFPLAAAIDWNVLDASPESNTYRKVLGTVTAVTLGDAQAAAKTLYATPHIVQVPETAVSKPITAEAPAANQSTTTTVTSTEAAPTAAKPKRQRKATAEPKEKKVSALDAAAKVLAEEGRPMSCKEMIETMATKGYWTSPGGQTPDATLYSAILREVSTKGTNSRFQKTERGKFARTNVA